MTFQVLQNTEKHSNIGNETIKSQLKRSSDELHAFKCVTNLQRNDTVDVDTSIWELTTPDVDNHENQRTSHEWSPTIWNGCHHLRVKKMHNQLVIADIII